MSRSSVVLMLLLAGGAAASGAGSPHVVRSKATTDDARFTTHCLVLPDGAFLAYYIKPGRAATLLLIPETHGDRTQFYERSFLDNLLSDLQVIVIETRGQGRSWPPPSPAQASIEQYADDVLAVVRHLGLSRFHVGGHSLGGMIALEIAGRRPAGLQSVIALEGWVHHTVQRNAFPTRAARPAAEQAEARRQREERYRTQRWNPDEVAALTRMWTSWNSGERIVRDIEVRLLSVWGDRGQASRPSRAQLLLPDNPAIELYWVRESDHYVTDPPFAADVARAINEFIAR